MVYVALALSCSKLARNVIGGSNDVVGVDFCGCCASINVSNTYEDPSDVSDACIV